jgi:NAD-dependent deacetylase
VFAGIRQCGHRDRFSDGQERNEATAKREMKPTTGEIAEFARLLRGSGGAVVFTGAGMSTESGLPDFRSASGLWKTNRRFEELASRNAIETSYAEFVEFYRWRIQMLNAHQPHPGHRVLAGWQRRGLVETIITQNVDGYHTTAGADGVLELHGTLRQVRCENCGGERPNDDFLQVDGFGCPCGGKRRPTVVLFGEMLPGAVLAAAAKASQAARLFIVLGSSLQVSPANRLPELALLGGATLVIVNREPTPFGSRASLDLRGSIGETLQAVEGLLGSAEQSP